jgi:hypothetical protein
MKSPVIGLRPIGGSFFNKIKSKIWNSLLSAFGQFEAHFSTKFNTKYKIPFYYHFLTKLFFFKPKRVVKPVNLLQMFLKISDKNLSQFGNISSEEIDFEVWNGLKSSVIRRFKIGHSPDQLKLAFKNLHTIVTWYVTIGAQVDIPSGRR